MEVTITLLPPRCNFNNFKDFPLCIVLPKTNLSARLTHPLFNQGYTIHTVHHWNMQLVFIFQKDV